MIPVGFILSCYDRYDDLNVNLEILRFYPRPKRVIVVHMGDGEVDPKLADDVVRIPSPGFKRGTVLSLLEGFRRARDMGLPAVVYRNADDWLMNHPWTARNFDMLLSGSAKAAGYNWLTCGTDHDLALNELYLSVPVFSRTVGTAELFFNRTAKYSLCEHKAARWVRETINFKSEFYRLPGREVQPCIGLEPADMAAYAAQYPVPPDFFTRAHTNSRFYNQEWLLLGHHDLRERWKSWVQCRHLVPYASALEQMPHFRRWMAAVRGEYLWNTNETNFSRLKALGRIGNGLRRPGVLRPRYLRPVPRPKRTAVFMTGQP